MADSSPRLNVVTLGVRDFDRSLRFYEALGFSRKFRATGDEIAFLDAGGVVLALFRWNDLAEDAEVPAEPEPPAFRGMTLAWNCERPGQVDEAFARALAAGAKPLRQPGPTSYGGYCGYFADPDGHVWEVVQAPGFTFAEDGRLILPE
jgi:catechol 2,3-dioxygenase-like lactoylglutathione lyase family enzyme